MNDIAKALTIKISLHRGFLDLGARLYFGTAPRGTDYPYVTFMPVIDIPLRLQDAAPLSETDWHFKIWGSTALDVGTIYSKLMDVFNQSDAEAAIFANIAAIAADVVYIAIPNMVVDEYMKAIAAGDTEATAKKKAATAIKEKVMNILNSFEIVTAIEGIVKDEIIVKDDIDVKSELEKIVTDTDAIADAENDTAAIVAAIANAEHVEAIQEIVEAVAKVSETDVEVSVVKAFSVAIRLPRVVKDFTAGVNAAIANAETDDPIEKVLEADRKINATIAAVSAEIVNRVNWSREDKEIEEYIKKVRERIRDHSRRVMSAAADASHILKDFIVSLRGRGLPMMTEVNRADDIIYSRVIACEIITKMEG